MKLCILVLRVAILLFLLHAVCACGDDDGGISSAWCRFEPWDCDARAGAFCDSDRDCIDVLFCCRDNKNCGTGMCTASCRTDHDCPPDMLCEHDMCFYACHSDRDCAQGMSCEHNNTVCEWD